MRTTLLFSTLATLIVMTACAQLPTQPSDRPGGMQAGIERIEPVRLENFNGTYIGRQSDLCEIPNSPMAIDHLSFDFAISGVDLSGAWLVACDTPKCESGRPLGAVTECPVPPHPCDAGLRHALEQGAAPACLTGDPTGAGSIEVLTMQPWERRSTYNVVAYFENSGDRSNTVSTTVVHE
jgi:hypothetical protein